jgi:hypothetical protein
MFQVEMHVRTHVPFLKIVSLNAVLAKLGITSRNCSFLSPHIFLPQSQSGVPHRITKLIGLDDTIAVRNVNVNQSQEIGAASSACQ